MKRKAPPGSRPAKIRKLQLSVQTFVEKAEGGGSQNSSQVSEEHLGFGGRGKSRKELRKEKRLSKKLRRKEYYERRGGSAQQPAQPAEHGPPRDKAPPIPPVLRAEARGQDRKRPAGGKKPGTEAKKKKMSKEEARKKALLEANEKEEKEIKKLEKSLRMNKRKNKSSLPQAFTQDGLDYILGVLEPGGSASGLYDEEKEEEDTAEKIWGLSHHPLQEDSKEGSEEEDKEDGLEESEEEDGLKGEDEDNSPEEQSEDDGVDQESEEEYDDEETLKHESDGGKEEEAAVNNKV